VFAIILFLGGWHGIVQPYVFDIRTDAQASQTASCLLSVHPVPHVWDEELVLLQKADPADEGYFVTHGISAVLLKNNDFYSCSGKKKEVSWGFTEDDSHTILLNGDLLSSPELRASTIAHELIHVKHGCGGPLSHHSHLQHIFISEEAEAHWKEFCVARALGAPHLSAVWADMIFILFMPVATVFLVGMLLLGMRHRGWLRFTARH